MSGSLVVAIVVLPLVLLLGRVGLVLGRAIWGFLLWLLEEPEGVTGALVRLLALGLLFHEVGVL